MTVLLATGNHHKVQEITAILTGYPLVLKDLGAYPGLPDPVEDGVTYAENALKKARHYSRITGQPALADDSGLEVDALEGRPGVHSSRLAGADTPHSVKIVKLLELLEGIPKERRSARFRCVAALVQPDGTELTAEGVVEGRIAFSPSGSQGFGYDPIFFLPGRGCTMAEVQDSVKNQISHRGRALRELMERLDLKRAP